MKKKIYEMNSDDIMKTSIFMKVDGTQINDIVKYIREYFNDRKKLGHSGFEIFIGTDSQKVRRGRITTYATVICLYTKGKGAHIIYAKTKRNDISPTAVKNKKTGRKKIMSSDLFYRLQWEVQYSMQVAQYLTDKKVFVEHGINQVHLDISADEQNESNVVYSYATGYVKSAGFSVRTKPEAIAATCAADKFVRNK